MGGFMGCPDSEPVLRETFHQGFDRLFPTAEFGVRSFQNPKRASLVCGFVCGIVDAKVPVYWETVIKNFQRLRRRPSLV